MAVEPVSADTDPGAAAVFAPVVSSTAFEETVDRLGTAIKLGLLPPGSQLPAERELCRRLGIARSTLRQALTALVQSGHVHAVRGRGGGTFVAESPPAAAPPSAQTLAGWRETCDLRLALESGTAYLAADRATPDQLAALDDLVEEMDGLLEDYAAYRPVDVRFHLTLARAAGSAELERAVTESQGAMTDLIAHIAHPATVLGSANAQHAAVMAAVRRHDAPAAASLMASHVLGTEHVLAGLLP